MKKINWIWFLSFAWLSGILLRTLFVQDMEYKEDEEFNFTQAHLIATGAQGWPWVGIASGVYVVNPGMSVWVFAVLAKIFAIHTPLGLERAVQLFALAGISLLIPFIFKFVKENERIPWLWAMAFSLVNPFAILYQRKLWPEPFLPFFTMLTLMGWWKRDKKWGAFTWGLVGACLGQVHMSGFFFAAALFVWTALFEKRVSPKRSRWAFWLMGSVLGALPLIPWAYYTLTHHAGGPISSGWVEIQQLKFWVFWMSHALGLHLGNALGIHFGNSQLAQLQDFFRYPVIAGQPTYLMAVVHALALTLGLYLLMRAIGSLWARGKFWRKWLIGTSSETTFVQHSAFIGFGILMTLTGIAIRRYYIEVAFPLEFVWLARIALSQPKHSTKILGALWACQLLISATFVGYVHVHHGSPNGDYGAGYSTMQH